MSPHENLENCPDVSALCARILTTDDIFSVLVLFSIGSDEEAPVKGGNGAMEGGVRLQFLGRSQPVVLVLGLSSWTELGAMH